MYIDVFLQYCAAACMYIIVYTSYYSIYTCLLQGCKCDNYLYMYRRPEEIGQYYLTRRKGKISLFPLHPSKLIMQSDCNIIYLFI